MGVLVVVLTFWVDTDCYGQQGKSSGNLYFPPLIRETWDTLSKYRSVWESGVGTDRRRAYKCDGSLLVK